MIATFRLITSRRAGTWLRAGGVLMGLFLCGPASFAQELPASPIPAANPPAARRLVADVIITGNRNVPTANIKALLKTRTGMEYSDSVAQDDVRTLMATRQFGNIETVAQPTNDGRVNVHFLIRDLPSVVHKVTYVGAKHLSDDELTSTTGVRVDQPLNPINNKLACQAIVKKLNEDGRPFAQCFLDKGDKPGDTEVVFNITEGPKVKVNDISFTGVSFVSGPVLATHLMSSAGLFHLFRGNFNPQMLEADEAKVEEYLKSFGFLDAKCKCERRFSPRGDTVDLIFHVREGVRYRVDGAPHITGNKVIPLEQLDQISQIKAHDWVEKNKIDADVKNMTDYYGLTGRNAKVGPNIIFDHNEAGVVRVNYEVEEAPVAHVGTIHVDGNDRTKMEVILRQIPLYPGQILTYPDLRVAERNLARLGIFKISPDGSIKPTVTILDNPDPNNPDKDILVQVQEDNTGSLMFGVGVNSDAGLTGSIVLNERNFDITRFPTSIDDLLSGNAWRGAGQEFRVEAVPGTQLQRYSMNFREPFLFDSQYSLGVGGYYYDRVFNEDDETRIGGRMTLGRRLNQYWTASASVRVEDIRISNVLIDAPPDYLSVVGDNFLCGVKGQVSRDTRDSIIRPTQGSLLDISYEECFGDHTFPLVNVELNNYFTVFQRNDNSGRFVLALHNQVSFAGDNTPVYERYFAGGFRSLRGFAFRGVGPSINDFMVGGTFQLLNSAELQIPVVASDKFFVVTFVDGGTVESNPEIKNYRVAAGFGFRFQVPMLGQVPIALDFGFPIVKASTDQTQVFNFWLGFTR
jgi:outer membrane protein assembly complex protein YaeT